MTLDTDMLTRALGALVTFAVMLIAIIGLLMAVRIRRLRAALRFYADWLNYHRDESIGKPKSIVECDEGARARKALGEKG